MLKSVDDIQVPDDIEEKLREAAKHRLTRDELRAQRISFAMGMMSHKSKMTREEVEKLLDSEDW